MCFTNCLLVDGYGDMVCENGQHAKSALVEFEVNSMADLGNMFQSHHIDPIK